MGLPFCCPSALPFRCNPLSPRSGGSLPCGLLCLCLMLAVSARAQVAAHAPASATNIVRVHPGPWRLPARATLAGMRFDPEGGEAATDLGVTASRDEEAAFRARAASLVRTAADGSRHLLLGGALRSWTVATIDD